MRRGVFSCYCYGAEVMVYFHAGGNDAVETEKKVMFSGKSKISSTQVRGWP